MALEDILAKRKKISDPSIRKVTDFTGGFEILATDANNETVKADLKLIQDNIDETMAAKAAVEQTNTEVQAAEDLREQNELARETDTAAAILQVNTAKAAVEQTNAEVQAAEDIREQDELARGQNEISREEAEILRRQGLNFHYIRYASDDQGTGFSAIPSALLKWRGEIHSATPIESPTSADFVGKWFQYIGDVTAADLALKAAHGYVSNPKTLKEIDDKTVQIEGNFNIDLLPDTTITTQRALNIDGTDIGSTGVEITGFIPVAQGDEIYYSGYIIDSLRAGVVTYNAAHVAIAALTIGPGQKTNEKHVIGAGVAFIKGSSTNQNHPTNPSTLVVDKRSNFKALTQSIQNVYQRVDDTNQVVENVNSSIENILNVFSGEDYYSAYNKDSQVVSQTTIQSPAPVLSAAGDYVEIKCRVNDATKINVYRNILNLLFNDQYSRFGFYDQDSIWLRASVEAYATWDALTVTSTNWNIIKLIVTGTGWELFLNGVSQGVKTKLADFPITGIAKAGIDMYAQAYDIKYVKIHTSLTDLTIDPLALYSGSENVTLAKTETVTPENPLCLVTYVAGSSPCFKVYMRDQTKVGIYYMIKIFLNTTVGSAVDEIVYSHHWEITNESKICTYADGIMTETTDILVSGESECVFMNIGAGGETKSDHTGGVHGDEKIDINASSFVKFYIDGVRLTDAELAENFSLRACNEFMYIQNSTMHDTANITLNKDTGLTASGAGVLTINATSHHFEIDGVDTGITAWGQTGYLTSTTGLTVGISGTNTWTISSVNEIVNGHSIIAYHLKKTVLKDQSYKTFNRLTFDQARTIPYWYHGICCISKNLAKFGHNDDYVDVEFTGSGNNFLTKKGARLFESYNPITKQAARITSILIKGGDDADCQMFVWDRSTDSKYYRRISNVNTAGNLVMESEMTVEFSSLE